MVRAALLLVFAALMPIAAVELRYQVPDPIPVDRTIRAQVQFIGALTQNITQLTIDESSDITADLNTSNQTRSQVSGGPPTLGVEVRLRAQRAGTVTLPIIRATFSDGTRLASTPQTVQIRDPVEYLSGDVVAGVRFDPPLIVIGQTTTAELTVYMRRDSGWQEAGDWLPELPAWAIAMGDSEESQGYVVDQAGAIWTVLSSRRSLTVDQPGSRVLGGQVRLMRGDRWGRRESDHFPLNPGTLIVRDISGLQRPPDDRGLVGPVVIEATLDRERIALGEGARLQVIVRGRQADLVTELSLPALPGLRLYAPEGGAGRGAGSHERRFEWQVVPQETGTFVIPAIDLPWLDPDGPVFRRAQSEPLHLQVIPGRQRSVEQRTREVVSLPPPLQRDDWPTWSLARLWMLGIACWMLVLVAGAVYRLRHWRPQRHRGRELARALRQGDLAQANVLADSLISSTADIAQRERLRQALRALERARFGGLPLDNDALQALLALEGVP